jgi:nucleoside-diphosphate-sugar epimerase
VNGKSPRILLTGATGFLGGAVLARWLQGRAEGSMILPVRAGSVREGNERVARSLARFGAEPRSCSVVTADLSDPGSLSRLEVGPVTHVLHLAAHTSFRSAQTARRVNVDGTLALAKLAGRSSELRRFVHVGTAMICGDRPGRLVREDDYPRREIRWLVPYTETKAEAEERLGDLDLPLIVARPSIVVGHRQLGCGPSGSIFWVFRAMDRLGWTAWDLDGRIDVVPVDWVADALLRLLFADRPGHRRYHLSAGEQSSVTWREIGRAFGRSVPYDVRPRGALEGEREKFAELFGPCDPGRVLTALDLYYQFASLNVVFDNSRLGEIGIAAPPKFTSYLSGCLERPRGLSIAEQMKDDD